MLRTVTTAPPRIGVALVVLLGTVVACSVAFFGPRSRLPDTRLLAPDHPYVRLDREITAEFGMQNPLAWVIESRDGTVWTPEGLHRVQALSRDVLKIPGVIAPTLISLASPNLRDVHVTEGMLEPVYLMGTVPDTAAAIARLRRRIETDPNYHGTLVSKDGRAAMVVADFRPEADVDVVGRAALALRAQYSDTTANVYVVGAPVLRTLAPTALWPGVDLVHSGI